MTDQTPGREQRMRRVPPGDFDEFSRARLYLDDLERIEDIFRRTCGRAVKIIADDYEFDRASDLPLLGKMSVEVFRIEGWDPYAHFEIRKYIARTYISDSDDMALRGLRASIRAEVERRPVAPRDPKFGVTLRRSNDPGPPPMPGLLARNREIVAAVISAILTFLFTLLLVWLGVLKAGS